MEYFMIKVRIGDETFYDTAKRLEARRRAEKHAAARALEDRVSARKKANTTEPRKDTP